jgi:hypothetical protein
MAVVTNSFIDAVNKIRDNLDIIISAQDIFSPENISKLDYLSNIDLSLILNDFSKGNYLGNRKVDIDLALNNLSLTVLPTYSQADIILVDGTLLSMPFDNGSGGVLELTSHADIKSYIATHALYAQVVDTELVVTEAFGDDPAMIRVRDADGKASNIERIELYVYTGTVENTKPVYFWAKTTSSLETLANRAGDIIQLGNDIDSIVLLSQRINELVALQADIASVLAVQTDLASVVTTATNIADVKKTATNIADINTIGLKIVELNAIYTNIAGILESSTNAQTAVDQAAISTQKASESSGSATAAANSAILATTKSDEIKAVSSQAQNLVAGSSATVSYNAVDGKFTFGIPQGTKGDKGDNFTINAVGLASDISLYDAQITGFSFLAIDTALIYFKVSAATGDWSLGSPFGKGDTGATGATGISISSIAFISTTDASGLAAKSGGTDTYRITFSDTNTSDFNVYNGLDTDITSSDLLVHTNNVTNPHGVTKTQLVLGNVDNTSDANKPVSTAQQIALNLKLNANANAVGATKLVSPRKINGIYFDGTADINLYTERPTKTATNKILVDGLELTIPAPALVAGKDLYFSRTTITTTQDAATIGGFHYSLVPVAEAPTGNKTEADMVLLRGINAHSIWTNWLRPVSDVRGKVLVGSRWKDIYLMDSEYALRGYSAPTVHTGANIAAGATTYGRAIPKIPLALGGNGTVTYGKFIWFQAAEVAQTTGNELISYEEFSTAMYGVVEGVDASAYGDDGTIFHIPELMSKYGIEQATGTEWIWGADIFSDTSGAYVWSDNADGRGQIYSVGSNPKAVLLGGSRDNGVNAGSRSSYWSYYVWNSSSNIGCRFACDLKLVA